MTQNPISPPHLEQKMSKNKVINNENGILVAVSMLLFSLLVGLGIGYVIGSTLEDRIEVGEGVECTLEALICPDGTPAERLPNSCEYVPCP